MFGLLLDIWLCWFATIPLAWLSVHILVRAYLHARAEWFKRFATLTPEFHCNGQDEDRKGKGR